MPILHTFYTDYIQIYTRILSNIINRVIFIKVFKTYILILYVSNYTKYHNIKHIMINNSMYKYSIENQPRYHTVSTT